MILCSGSRLFDYSHAHAVLEVRLIRAFRSPAGSYSNLDAERGLLHVRAAVEHCPFPR